MYHFTPFTYLIEGLLANAVDNIPAYCQASDFSVLNSTPNGETCGSYFQSYLAANGGYVNNPNATSGCQVCQYSNGNQYTAQLNIFYDHRWSRDYPIMWGYTIFNLLLVSFALFVRLGGFRKLKGRKASK